VFSDAKKHDDRLAGAGIRGMRVKQPYLVGCVIALTAWKTIFPQGIQIPRVVDIAEIRGTT
jgi:hypothetical protein